ncbi:MAG: AZOBR_p60025 family cell surface glycopolymer formation protein [Anaerolineae bacterium]
MVVGLVVAIYGGLVLATHDWDPLAFARVGTRFSDQDPSGTEGYDGQFAYQIALNPAGAAPFLDVPAYRYQRILYPLLARILALGQPAWIPWTLILANGVALVAGTWILERLLVHFGAGRWYALGLGFYSGQLLSFRLDLNEPLATLWVLLALWRLEKRKWAQVGLFFALAGLTKESSAIFLAAVLIWLLWRRAFREAGMVGSIGGIPLVLYQAVLALWLGSPGIGSGGAGATAFARVPFGGLWAIFPYGAEVFALFLLIMIPWVVLPTLACLAMGSLDLARGERHYLPWLLLANALVTMFLPFSTFREPLAMARLTVGLVLTVILYGAWKGSRRTLNYSLFWLASLALLFKE